MEKEEGLVVRGRVEIDMRQPFRSVKEAVALFGERVLAGQVYANKLKEMMKMGNTSQELAELEETKQSLEKAKEEGKIMAYYLTSLKQELEETKKELKHLKTKEAVPLQRFLVINDDDPKIEELKFIKNPTRKADELANHPEIDQDPKVDIEFEKKRSVKFASPPSLSKVIVSRDVEGELLVTSPLVKKKGKWKPRFGGLFSRKKGSQEGDHSPRTPEGFK